MKTEGRTKALPTAFQISKGLGATLLGYVASCMERRMSPWTHGISACAAQIQSHFCPNCQQILGQAMGHDGAPGQFSAVPKIYLD